MTDILIRGTSEDDLQRVDAAAERLGLSRNEFVKRLLHSAAKRSPGRVTVEDLQELSSLAADLDDPDVMRGAWS